MSRLQPAPLGRLANILECSRFECVSTHCSTSHAGKFDICERMCFIGSAEVCFIVKTSDFQQPLIADAAVVPRA